MTDRMHPDDLARLADLVAERVLTELQTERPLAAPLLTADEVARAYSVKASWVRENADSLGVIRLSDGPRARLRFDPDVIAERMTRSSGSKTSRVSKNRSPKGPRTEPADGAPGTSLDNVPVCGFDSGVPNSRASAALTASPVTPKDELQRKAQRTARARSRTPSDGRKGASG